MIVRIAYGLCLVFAGYSLAKNMYVEYVFLMGVACVLAWCEGYIQDQEKSQQK
jgi:hypothetical protein